MYQIGWELGGPGGNYQRTVNVANFGPKIKKKKLIVYKACRTEKKFEMNKKCLKSSCLQTWFCSFLLHSSLEGADKKVLGESFREVQS